MSDEQAIEDAYMEHLKTMFDVYVSSLVAPVQIEDDDRTPEERFQHGLAILRKARDQAKAMVKQA